MSFDDIMGGTVVQTQTIQNVDEQKTNHAHRICADTLRALGYEIGENEGNITVKKGTIQYSLSVTYAEPQSETHFRIPVGVLNDDTKTIFSMKADCIAFYQERYDGGTMFQFKLDGLRQIVEPIVKRLKEEMKIAFYAHNAIQQKRIHACHRPETDGYVMYLYLPIEFVCKQLKYSKQRVGSKM